jgi:ketosteroid isomerase-like protein
MSQENLDAVRTVYEEWAKGNLRAGVELFDPDVLLIPLPEIPHAGRYLGTESMRNFMRGWMDAWRNLTFTAEDFIEADNSIVVAVRQEGVGRESGTPIDFRYFSVWTFRGRAVIRMEDFSDRAQALEAVGLSE